MSNAQTEEKNDNASNTERPPPPADLPLDPAAMVDLFIPAFDKLRASLHLDPDPTVANRLVCAIPRNTMIQLLGSTGEPMVHRLVPLIPPEVGTFELQLGDVVALLRFLREGASRRQVLARNSVQSPEDLLPPAPSSSGAVSQAVPTTPAAYQQPVGPAPMPFEDPTGPIAPPASADATAEPTQVFDVGADLDGMTDQEIIDQLTQGAASPAPMPSSPPTPSRSAPPRAPIQGPATPRTAVDPAHLPGPSPQALMAARQAIVTGGARVP